MTTTKNTKVRNAKVAESTELEIIKTGYLEVVDIDDLREQASGKGVSTDAADNVVPLLKIAQALSPVVLKQSTDYIKGAEAGNIYPRGEKIVWDGDEGIRVVPCHFERTWLEWGPQLGDGLKGRHRDGKDDTPIKMGAVLKKADDGRMKWTLPNGNILQDNREHVVLVLDKYSEPTPFVVPMASSNIGTSKKWHPMMNKKKTKKGKKAAAYGYVYLLTSVPRKKDQFNWYGWEVDDLDEVSSEAVFRQADEIQNSFTSGTLIADVEHPDAARATTDDVPF